MKKGTIIMICLGITFLLANCYKEPTYNAIIKCYYSENGIEKGDPVDSCEVTIGREGYAEFAKREGYTDKFGQFKPASFKYEALLEVRAHVDGIDLMPITNPVGDTIGYYEVPYMHFGKGELKLVADEEVTLELLLVKEPL